MSMNYLKTYETVNPLESKKKTEENDKPGILTKEIQHKIKLIEKAFR